MKMDSITIQLPEKTLNLLRRYADGCAERTVENAAQLILTSKTVEHMMVEQILLEESTDETN